MNHHEENTFLRAKVMRQQKEIDSLRKRIYYMENKTRLLNYQHSYSTRNTKSNKIILDYSDISVWF